MNIRALLLLALSSLLAGGCASIISDDESSTFIETVPVACECTLCGQNYFQTTLKTPGSIRLDSEHAPIAVNCRAEGYQDASMVLDTSSDGWVFGNIIFGGIIGGVVDACRGAGQKYPPKITIIMDPASFASAADRDEYFEARTATIRNSWNERIEKARGKCAKNDGACERRVAKMETQRDKELGELNVRRLAARIRTNQAPETNELVSEVRVPAVPAPPQTASAP